ncbi:MGMT family protein [uncultured Alistipes sp.]|uniref:MGMT family protein n=1 Tax=uncultured Alistipes sp. TaxID=538949 RepID=UPI002605B7C6|nr:MGMT family protein [uncultured Alistipes sp.]
MLPCDFDAEVRDVVRRIPRGRVVTYGTIARLVGCPAHARRVGRTLARACDASLPCHRVVACDGRTAPGWPEQRALLEAEGVTFGRSGRVAMRRYAWPLPEE